MGLRFWQVKRGVADNGLTYRTIASRDGLTMLALVLLVLITWELDLVNGILNLALAAFIIIASVLPFLLGSALARRRGQSSYIGQMAAINLLMGTALLVRGDEPSLLLLPVLTTSLWVMGLGIHLLIRRLIDKHGDLARGHINKTVI